MCKRPSPRPCRVLLIDENDAFLDGLTDWFAEAAEVEIVGRAHSQAEALLRISSLDPDVVLIDTRLPDGNGFDVTGSIKAGASPPLVVMMSFHESDHIRTTALSNGADGCITKADVPEKLSLLVEELVSDRETGSRTARDTSTQSRRV